MIGKEFKGRSRGDKNGPCIEERIKGNKVKGYGLVCVLCSWIPYVTRSSILRGGCRAFLINSFNAAFFFVVFLSSSLFSLCFAV